MENIKQGKHLKQNVWTYFTKSEVLKPTSTDKIAFLYLSNSSSFVSLPSIDISFSLAGDFTLADNPLVDRTPAFNRDKRTPVTLAGISGIGVLLLTFAAVDATLFTWG